MKLRDTIEITVAAWYVRASDYTTHQHVPLCEISATGYERQLSPWNREHTLACHARAELTATLPTAEEL